jgi:LPS-assembly lipoprotein
MKSNLPLARQKKTVLYPRWLAHVSGCMGLVILLASCGFSLRSTTPLPFETLYLGIPDTTRFGAQIRRAVRAASPETVLVTDSKQAEASLQVVRNDRTLIPVSLNAQGRVNEYTLGLTFTFRLIDQRGRVLLPDTTLTVFRDMPYDDQLVEAKQSQIETLFTSMQQSLVDRLVRRLAAPDILPSVQAARAHSADENGVAPKPETVLTPKRPTPTPWQQPSIHRGAEMFD